MPVLWVRRVIDCTKQGGFPNNDFLRLLKIMGALCSIIYFFFLVSTITKPTLAWNPIIFLIYIVVSLGVWLVSGIIFLLSTDKPVSLPKFSLWGQTEFLKNLPGGVWNHISREKAEFFTQNSRWMVLGFMYSGELVAASFFALLLINSSDHYRNVFLSYSVIAATLLCISLSLYLIMFFKLRMALSKLLMVSILLFIHWMGIYLELYLIFLALQPTPSLPISIIVGSFAFSWLLGFLVFFVPSGLGIRELFFIKLLALANIDSEKALIAIVLLRISTFFLDLFFGFISMAVTLLIRNKSNILPDHNFH
jgi:uncharacterized membrane protein YbhN (UPF0104 family)